MVLDSVVGPWDWYDFDVVQSRALLRQRDTFFAWAAAHADRFALGDSAHAVRRAYLRVRDGLTARLRDGTVATLRPATAFDGPDSRTYESANRVTKCADAPAPPRAASSPTSAAPGPSTPLDHDYSHGVFASRGNTCVDRTAAAYLVDGTLPTTDVRCTGPGLPEVRSTVS